MDCSNCGAPLPAKTNVCAYCRTLNEVDLRTVRRGSEAGGASERGCPRCEEPLVVLAIEGAGVEVDRCETCLGIFFDPGELEDLLDRSVRAPAEADYERLDQLVEQERKTDAREIVYRPCPDCGQLMNRKAYGARSGVVVDRCREHGVWLDGGELAALVKWVRAGGLEHARRAREHAAREDEARRRTASFSGLDLKLRQLDPSASSRRSGSGSAFDDLGDVGSVIGVIARWLS